MIYGQLKDADRYSFLKEDVKTCLTYAKTHDLMALEPGSHPIDGERIYVNIASYETTTPENRFWEAHKKYIDLHVMLDGCEQILLNFVSDMKAGAFVEQDDFLPLDGQSVCSVLLRKNDFLICYPEDGHMTGVRAAEPVKLKKAIFKILL